jgi:hypothetical protein
MFKTPFEIDEALTVIPVAFAIIPDPALILIATSFAVTIELDRLILPANNSKVLVVLPSGIPFPVGINSPLMLVLLYARFPTTVRLPLTTRDCLTIT